MEHVSAAPVRLGAADAYRCRRRVHLDHDPDADRASRRSPDAGLRLRLATNDVHRADIRSALEPLLGLPAADSWDRGVHWNTVLESATRIARIDLLLPDPNGGLIPILIRGHRTTTAGGGIHVTTVADLATWRPGSPMPRTHQPGLKLRSHYEDALALAHAYRLLQELGAASTSLRGGIVGLGSSANDTAWDDGATVVWHDVAAPHGPDGARCIDDYDARYSDRLAVARAAAGRRRALATPSRVAECRRCPWWTVCGPQLAAAHDVSLLVAGHDVEMLRSAGANTYDEVAVMDPQLLADLPLTGVPAAEVQLRARAMAAGLPMVRRAEATDVVRADVELDVDMESFQDDGAYLWGTYLSGQLPDGYREGYRAFATWHGLDTDHAAENFVQFWQYLTELRARCRAEGKSFAAYCYSHKAEERWLYGTPARFPHVSGMPGRDEVAEFCQSDEWVDLYLEVKRLFVVPGSLRLKVVAPVAGHAWRDPEPGGENSMAWYQIATGAADCADYGLTSAGAGTQGMTSYPAGGMQQREVYRRRILQYNEDDVLATLRLRRWISEHGWELPTVSELMRPRDVR